MKSELETFFETSPSVPEVLNPEEFETRPIKNLKTQAFSTIDASVASFFSGLSNTYTASLYRWGTSSATDFAYKLAGEELIEPKQAKEDYGVSITQPRTRQFLDYIGDVNNYDKNLQFIADEYSKSLGLSGQNTVAPMVSFGLGRLLDVALYKGASIIRGAVATGSTFFGLAGKAMGAKAIRLGAFATLNGALDASLESQQQGMHVLRGLREKKSYKEIALVGGVGAVVGGLADYFFSGGLKQAKAFRNQTKGAKPTQDFELVGGPRSSEFVLGKGEIDNFFKAKFPSLTKESVGLAKREKDVPLDVYGKIISNNLTKVVSEWKPVISKMQRVLPDLNPKEKTIFAKEVSELIEVHAGVLKTYMEPKIFKGFLVSLSKGQHLDSNLKFLSKDKGRAMLRHFQKNVTSDLEDVVAKFDPEGFRGLFKDPSSLKQAPKESHETFAVKDYSTGQTNPITIREVPPDMLSDPIRKVVLKSSRLQSILNLNFEIAVNSDKVFTAPIDFDKYMRESLERALKIVERKAKFKKYQGLQISKDTYDPAVFDRLPPGQFERIFGRSLAEIEPPLQKRVYQRGLKQKVKMQEKLKVLKSFSSENKLVSMKEAGEFLKASGDFESIIKSGQDFIEKNTLRPLEKAKPKEVKESKLNKTIREKNIKVTKVAEGVSSKKLKPISESDKKKLKLLISKGKKEDVPAESNPDILDELTPVLREVLGDLKDNSLGIKLPSHYRKEVLQKKFPDQKTFNELEIAPPGRKAFKVPLDKKTMQNYIKARNKKPKDRTATDKKAIEKAYDRYREYISYFSRNNKGKF